MENHDKYLREQFSEILGAGYKHEMYSGKEKVVYSWEQIFTQVGRLLQKKQDVEQEHFVSELARRISILEKQGKKLDQEPFGPQYQTMC